MNHWKRQSEIFRITSAWMALVAEKWQDYQSNEVEYWRIEKVDSVIVVPLQAGCIYCVVPTFRPGVGFETLDLPGGRLRDTRSPIEEVPPILGRELGIEPGALVNVEALNKQKWNINSSFSNQGLWAFAAEIDESFRIPEDRVGKCVPATREGVNELLEDLDCLQCRAVLAEWCRRLN